MHKKKSFWKISLSSLATALCLGLFAGCSDDSSSGAPDGGDENKEDVIPCDNSANALGINNTQIRVDEGFWNKALASVWEGIKARNIEPYGTGLIHRPKSEKPGDAVSEGVGYGMLAALFSNDQATFNRIWEAGNQYMWGRCYYNWQVNPSGKIIGTGAASDAEQDIALALIFADKLAADGKWTNYKSEKTGSYKEHALRILNCMWSTKQITGNGVLAPGAGWGGNDFMNPGYFSPAWYKIFATVDNAHNWTSVVDKSYEIIENSPGAPYGMVMDWMTPTGGAVASANLGYNAYGDGMYFFKDAIRILWRVALDAVWFDEPRAKAFLTKALNFINSKGGASASNFYKMDGELVPETDMWTDMAAGTISRTRREHSPITIGMWATAAMAVGDSASIVDFSSEMKKVYDGGDYFGNAVDPLGGTEDTLHNEMYFEQFLGWFGTSLMSGAFVNVMNDAPASDIKRYYTTDCKQE